MRITESKLKRIIRNMIFEVSGHYKVGDHRMAQLGSVRKSNVSNEHVLPYTRDQILERLINDCDNYGYNVSEIEIDQAIAKHASRFYDDVLEDLMMTY